MTHKHKAQKIREEKSAGLTRRRKRTRGPRNLSAPDATERIMQALASQNSADSSSALLGSLEMAHPANLPVRQAIVRHLQARQGNAYVQRLVDNARTEALLQRQVEEEEEELVQTIQRGVEEEEASKRGNRSGQLANLLHDSGTGHPLDTETQARMSEHLGYDLSTVRIHDDTRAHRANEILTARAFTRGRDIFLGEAAPSLRSSQGQALLAHELTHVVQQASGQPIQTAGEIDGFAIGGEQHEREAERVARAYVEEDDRSLETTTLQLERDPTKTTIQRDDGDDMEVEPEEPITDRWLIRIAGGASVGAVVAGEVVIAEICDPETRIGAAFRYLGVGGGIGLGELQLPSPPGGVSGPSEWQEVTLPRPIRLADFAGNGSVTSAGIGVGGVGVGSTVLIFSHPARITGEYVNVEFRGAPLLGAGFTATTGSWVKSPPYPMTI